MKPCRTSSGNGRSGSAQAVTSRFTISTAQRWSSSRSGMAVSWSTTNGVHNPVDSAPPSALPKTLSGKIRRVGLQQLDAGRRGRDERGEAEFTEGETEQCLSLNFQNWWEAVLPVRFISKQRPSFVVAPHSTNLQVAGRKSFFLETRPASERNRGQVSGLDVCFQAMEPDSIKYIGACKTESLSHKALPCKINHPIVTEISTSKEAPGNLTEVYNANYAVRDSMSDHQTDIWSC